MSVGKVGEFECQSASWSSYIDRLEMYFLVNDVKADLHLPTLISVMGNEAYELLVNLASPKKPSELTYKEAVEMISLHIEPAPSVLAERYRFRQRRQAKDENIASYVAELKKLARNCKFETTLNAFVCGLRSDVIRQRLFAEDDTLTYANAVKIASSLEAAERDAAAVEATSGTGEVGAGAGGSTGVHVMVAEGSGQRSSRGSRSGGGWRSRSASGPARGGARGTRGSARAGGSASTAAAAVGGGGRRVNCAGCGATDHDYANCCYRDYVCSSCQRVGHLRRVCPGRDGGVRGGNGPGRLHYGEAAKAEDPDQGKEPTVEDFHHLCLNDYKPV